MITEITSFKTDDGRTFETIQEARSHEASRKLIRLMDESSVGRGGEWDQRMFFGWLVENAERVAELLDDIESS